MLTRFEGLGAFYPSCRSGPTIPELAALMGHLVVLKPLPSMGDLGQMMFRGAGETRMWSGMRRVPVGLVFLQR